MTGVTAIAVQARAILHLLFLIFEKGKPAKVYKTRGP